MPTIPEALATAVQQHRAGQFARAEHLYQQILHADPAHVDAWHLLGLCRHQTGRQTEAADCIGRALALRPDFADAHYNLGNVLRELGRLDAAAASYRRALRLAPERVEALFNLGNVLREQGRLDEAAAAYVEALRHKPDYVKALVNLGRTRQQQGRLDDAAASFRRILALQPRSAKALGGLGNVLRDQGKLLEAVASYRQALQAEPDDAETLNNLGVVLQRQGRIDEALDALRHALRARPDYAEAHTNLGIALRERGLLAEAVASFEKALGFKPDLAVIRMNLGAVLREQGKPEEAVAHLREALRLDPALAEAYGNLSVALLEVGQAEEALGCADEATRRQPASPEAHANRSAALRVLNRVGEAVDAARAALCLRPDDPERWNGLAIALADAGRRDEALAACSQALRVEPGHAAAHITRGFLLLGEGDWRRGLLEYEWRWKSGEIRLPSFAQPRWDGSPLGGRTLLLQAEQGLGDAIHFVRYAALAKAHGGRVVVNVPKPLARVFSTCLGVDGLCVQGSPLPPFDLYAPLMSLPALFGTRPDSVPADVPYLFAEPDLRRAWRERLGARTGLRVGLVWGGNPKHRLDRRRSLPLEALAPLAAVEGVRLFSLQKGPATDALKQFGDTLRIVDCSDGLDDFADTAALLAELDLLVACDTAVAHLAGALGVPVWLALPTTPDWRWLTGRDDSPWYPTMRLFRQERLGDWDDVVRRVAGALKDVAEGRTRLTSSVEDAPAHRIPVAASEPPAEKPVAPDAAGVKLDRGVALARQGKRHQALALFDELVAERPDHAGAFMNRGILLADLGRLDDAVASYRRALELQPDHFGAVSNLGVALGRQDRHEEALACYRQALRVKPDFAEGHVNVASVYHKQEKWEEGIAELREALRLRPDMPEAHFSLGVNHARCGRPDEAETHLREALRLRPDHAEARMELANAALDRGRPRDAVALLREALLFRPDHADLRANAGILALLTGDFADGWLDYEWRLHCQGRTPPSYPRPMWDGGPLEGRTILLHFEQGLGDTIHFARYAPLVRARGGRVLLGCPRPLAAVMAACPGVDGLAVEGETPPPFDVHASLLTLPGLFGTDLTNLPGGVPYLSADPVRRARWRERLASVAGFRVGIVWRGSTAHPGDKRRSIPLARFEPLARRPGVSLVSLQKGQGLDELRELGERWSILDAGAGLNDFADTAALVAELDLVVTCDTSVAHLAGALGAAAWVALPFAPDWRWLTDREDSPWYPTMRLFRQRRPGDWEDVFERIAAALPLAASRPPRA